MGLGVSWMGGLGVSLKWGVPCREGSVMEGWGRPYIDGVCHGDVGWVMWGWGGVDHGGVG